MSIELRMVNVYEGGVLVYRQMTDAEQTDRLARQQQFRDCPALRRVDAAAEAAAAWVELRMIHDHPELAAQLAHARAVQGLQIT